MLHAGCAGRQGRRRPNEPSTSAPLPCSAPIHPAGRPRALPLSLLTSLCRPPRLVSVRHLRTCFFASSIHHHRPSHPHPSFLPFLPPPTQRLVGTAHSPLLTTSAPSIAIPNTATPLHCTQNTHSRRTLHNRPWINQVIPQGCSCCLLLNTKSDPSVLLDNPPSDHPSHHSPSTTPPRRRRLGSRSHLLLDNSSST